MHKSPLTSLGADAAAREKSCFVVWLFGFFNEGTQNLIFFPHSKERASPLALFL